VKRNGVRVTECGDEAWSVNREPMDIFNFHGLTWLIRRLYCRRTNHHNPHVRGYKEKGNISTPLELAIDKEIDRFSLAIEVINRIPGPHVAGAHVKDNCAICRSIAGPVLTGTALICRRSTAALALLAGSRIPALCGVIQQ
jgi:hypothetical protein